MANAAHQRFQGLRRRDLTSSLCALGAAVILTVGVAASAQDAGVAPRADAALADDPTRGLTLRQRLQGYFRDIPGAGNAQRRDEGVARAVEALFVLIRPMAHSRLTEANPVFPTVRIAFYDGIIDVATPPLAARSPETGARGTMRGIDGETNQLVQAFTSDALVQTSWREAGSRTTRFVPSADGQRLTLHIQIRSGRLPVPVRYSMSYARAAR
jgi:hypothetical protein